MLPKIISNITLALIAMSIIYMFAPLIKDLLIDLIGGQKKKNNKDDFEEMIKRKTEMLGGAGKVVTTSQPLTGSHQGTSTTARSDLDYLYENKYFLNTDEEKKFKELIKEFSWGTGDHINSYIKDIKSIIPFEIEDSHISNNLKKLCTKSEILNNFPEKGISSSTISNQIAIKIFIELLNNKTKSLPKQILAKSLACSIEQMELNLAVTVKKIQNQDWLEIIENYIDGKEFFELNLTKNIKVSEFINELKKNIDIIYPMTRPDANLIESIKKEKDEDVVKKKHKKLLSLYHPDKWTFANKTSKIDQRLRENFDSIQNIFSQIK